MRSTTKEHHYAIDAATILDECRKNLRFIIEEQKDRVVNTNVLDLDRTLLTTEQILHYHLLTLLEREQESVGGGNTQGGKSKDERGGHSHPNFPLCSGANTGTTTSPCSGSDGGDGSDGSAKTKYSTYDEMMNELDSSSHAVTLDPLMKTVENLKKVMKKKQKRKRSMSFLKWHQHNEQQIQQQEHLEQKQQRRKKKTIQRSSLTSKYYSKALKAAQKDLSISSNHDTGSGINTSVNAASINANIIDSHFLQSSKSSPLPTGPCNNSARSTASTSVVMNSSDKNALDSVLFRLIVALQLCLVRIEEADYLLCRHRQCHNHTSDENQNCHIGKNEWNKKDVDNYNKMKRRKGRRRFVKVTTATAIACTSTYFFTKGKVKWNMDTLRDKECRLSIIKASTKAIALTSASFFLRRGWRILCMNARLMNTICAIEDLHHQWMLVHSIKMDTRENMSSANDDLSDRQCKHLLKLIPFQKASSSIWESEGAFRYGLVKWAMDTLYASVGTAIKITKSNKEGQKSFMLPITAAAAASYYAIVGPSGKSAEVVSSETESTDLIRNAWGVVSLPAVKTLSLQASRLLKGAAIAERITICGVSCFILSKQPFPVLTTAIKRYRRQQERKLSRLSTIHEDFSYSQRAVNINEYPKKDVIFHLTGGGFFAHTIAGDVPYLMDWSFATEAVVICPEYALLPEHTFPVAIEEVTRVYLSLVNGHSPSLLGFQTDRIIVTGESTGGNLAASLCVKLCMDGLVDVEELTTEKRFRQAREETISQSTSLSFSEDDENDDDDQSHQPVTGMNRLPDALMLCCPALNLSLELSPSRVLGTKDAVLPSSLISTISDAYVPSSLQISKSDPIVSPYYAPDEILRIFPPTLLYASSEDPLLDDSVQFNTRLRANGVDSDLRAAHNVPHAYWGLGTAGFPEAVKVQRECEYWMVRQLHK